MRRSTAKLGLLVMLYAAAAIGGVKTAYACVNVPGFGQLQYCIQYYECCDMWCYNQCAVMECNGLNTGCQHQNSGQQCLRLGCYGGGPFCSGQCP